MKLEASSQQSCAKLQVKLGVSLLRGFVELQAKLTVSSRRAMKSFKAKLDKFSLLGEASPLGSCKTKY